MGEPLLPAILGASTAYNRDIFTFFFLLGLGLLSGGTAEAASWVYSLGHHSLIFVCRDRQEKYWIPSVLRGIRKAEWHILPKFKVLELFLSF
jgi:hypothetical protein